MPAVDFAVTQELKKRRGSTLRARMVAGDSIQKSGSGKGHASVSALGLTSSGDDDTSVVELREVSYHYKAVTALHCVSFSVCSGEFFSLLGPSGCGKTTTLNLIGGFIIPDAGDILIEGRSVVRVPPYARPVNTVFQSYALFPHMTVEENIAFGPRMAREFGPDVARRVGEALALVSLSGMEKRRPDQLSGGQQQRVALARALINRPTVLLLDEPLGALDLKLRRQMQVELGRIQRDLGVTFIYVTHDQEEALSMSDRIAVMNHGRVAQVGSPTEVYEHPASLFVADFIGSSNQLRGHLLEWVHGLATVRLSSGAIVQVPLPAPVPTGTPIVVVVRPDHAVIHQASSMSDCRNGVQGQVVKTAFLGTHLEIEVALQDRTVVMVRQSLAPTERRQSVPETGVEVVVNWPVPQSMGFSAQKLEEG
jgi:spermidine/putrescine transport system ATP-binding protein